MAKYRVKIIERMFRIGTLELEAGNAAEAADEAEVLVKDDYDEPAWGEVERTEIVARNVEEIK